MLKTILVPSPNLTAGLGFVLAYVSTHHFPSLVVIWTDYHFVLCFPFSLNSFIDNTPVSSMDHTAVLLQHFATSHSFYVTIIIIIANGCHIHLSLGRDLGIRTDF